MNWSAPFEQLQVGERFATPAQAVTNNTVLAFAALTGDDHPQHVDERWAADSHFGERIAHGMLIVSLAVGLVPFDPERVVALRRLSEVVFKRPVRLGDTIAVDGAISELIPLADDVGLVGWTWSVRNQDGALACRARVDVLWRRAGADD